MNEIILIGEVTSRILKENKDKLSTVYLKVTDEAYNRVDYIPVCFRCMDNSILLSLKGKEIGISGHVESKPYNRIFVDAFGIVK